MTTTKSVGGLSGTRKRTLYTLGLLLVGAAACASAPVEVLYGDTDCYRFYALNADIGDSTFSASGMQACLQQSNCPKLKSAKITVFDDTNGNGTPDPGEKVYGSSLGTADPPSDCITTGAISCGKNSKRGGTSWHAELENEDGGKTTHGGTF